MSEKVDILIVDDRPENLLALASLLENPGLNIVQARSGNEALGLTLQYDFALILLDVQMPEMDGFETAELLRSRQKTRHIPLIFITAINKDEQHIFRGYETGAVDYLFKPIAPWMVQSKVRVFVELYQQKKALETTTRTLEQTVDRLQQSQSDLRQSEEKYRLLIENANDAIVIIQEEQLAFHNRRTLSMTGYTDAELEDFPFRELVHPDDREMVMEKHHRRLSLRESSETYTFRFISKTGDTIYGEVSVILISWQNRPAVLCFIRDITRQRKLEAHLQQGQKMEAIGTLAGGIAHDFNNILGVIIGYSEMAVQEIRETPVVRHNLEQVLKASHRAKELVQQILSFSHKTEQDLKPVMLNPIVKETMKLIRASLPKTIDIQQEIADDLLMTLSTPTHIHQVLMNLCTNAAHAMEEDRGGVLTVRLAGCDFDTDDVEPFHLPAGSYVRLSVKDTGHGISPDILRRIFDPYFTTKEVGKGTGMGLSVVHGIVQSQNGGINVRSRPGNGTTFEILLPRILTQPPVPEEKPVPIPEGDQRILFVDDERLLARLGKQMLSRLGYEVESHTNPLVALEVFQESPDAFDLVVTDMTMPHLTGDILAQEIRRIRPDLPIIMCTGYSDRVDEEKARAMGINDFLLKPLAIRKLAEAIHRVLLEKEDG